MEIKILCENWNGFGYDTMLISQGEAEIKYVGYTREEAIEAFESYLIHTGTSSSSELMGIVVIK